ncbi:MAG: nucleotidyltransferase substrate binding protein [Agarilytica sp.]
MTDIRWHQRLSSFNRALSQLKDAVISAQSRELSVLERQGLIQAFEFACELAWNTIKDFYEAQGETDIQGGRDTFRLAFKRGLIENGNVWMEMIQSRVLSSHTYNESMAEKIMQKVITEYYGEYEALSKRLLAHK